MERIDDFFIYTVNMPGRIKAAVVPCAEGHTVYIDEKLSKEDRIKAYDHEVKKHIERNDFEKEDVQAIEADAHGE